MRFYMPVTVYEGASCVKQHAKELAVCGSCALIVTGRSAARTCGALADVQEALEAESRDWTIFDEVEENPSVETVVRGCACGRQASADFVIGIGGGSALDAAKAIAVLMANEGMTAEFLDEKLPTVRHLPVIAVPTTCGTGSEVTGVAVLTRHERKTKASMAHRVYPALALLDASYLTSASHELLCNTAVDALSHMLESWLNTNATEFSRALVREGLRLWRDGAEALTGEGEQKTAKLRSLLLASAYAGMAIAHTGTSLPHGLSYEVTYHLGIAHGKACAYFLAGYLAQAPAEATGELLALAGFRDPAELGSFLESLLDLTPLPGELLEQTVNRMAKNEAKLANCPYPVDRRVLLRIAGLTERE